MNDKGPDFFEEVNDEMKRQELVSLWQDNKYWIVGSIVAAIITSASMAGWRQWQEHRNVVATEELTKIVEAGMDNKALEAFAKDTTANHSVITRLILASNYVNDKKIDEAIKAYDEIAGTMSADRVYKNFAKLMSIKYRFQTAKTGNDELLKEVEDLTANKINWRYEALELKALLLASKGDFSKAVDTLGNITNDGQAPATIRDRAIKLTSLYKASEK